MKKGLLNKIKSNQRFWVGVFPYGWYLLFFLVPFLFIVRISFSEYELQIPPYSDLFEFDGERLNIVISLYNYLFLFTDDLYVLSYLNTLKISFISATATLLIGYPIAYVICRLDKPFRDICILLVILPSWTSFLIRTYAWIGILKDAGLLNGMLISLGIIDEPLKILYTETAIYIGVVYSYLPFMVFPVYAVLSKMDWSLAEASMDLGCGPIKTFFKVTVPLSKYGIISGFLMVFIPTIGEFVIPDLLGPSDASMIGRVIWQEFFNNKDWPLASAVTVIMLLFLLIPIRLFHNIQGKESI